MLKRIKAACGPQIKNINDVHPGQSFTWGYGIGVYMVIILADGKKDLLNLDSGFLSPDHGPYHNFRFVELTVTGDIEVKS